ncbi:MAG: hypothetical protein ACOYN6_06665 [Ignavibacteria bacterium]
MTKYYIMAIGGNGALATESLVHLCAAGVLEDCEINIMVVDPDQTNENVQRLQKAIINYIAIRDTMKQRVSKYFNAKINFIKVWNPNSGDDSNLENGISYVQLNKGSNVKYRILTNLLFSEEKRKEKLDKGYKGNPMIGTVFMKDIEEDESFREMAGEEMLNLFVFGSLFGGTGAAGLPVMGKSIRDIRAIRGGRTNIGSCIVLPYFGIKEPKSHQMDTFREMGVNLLPESSSFLPAVKFAIPYYIKSRKQKRNGYDAIYFVGCPDSFINSQREFAIGGREQKNKSHFVNLFAATSFIDYTQRKAELEKNTDTTFYATAVDLKDSTLRYENLPFCLDEEKSRNIESFYVSAIYHNKYLIQNGKNQFKGWFENKKPKGLELNDEFFSKRFSEDLKNYFDKYLLWLAQLKDNVLSFELFNTKYYDSEKDTNDINLYENDLISKYRLDGKVAKKSLFSSLEIQTLDKYFNEIVDSIDQSASDDSQKFLDVLKEGTKHFITKHYSKIK